MAEQELSSFLIGESTGIGTENRDILWASGVDGGGNFAGVISQSYVLNSIN